MLLKELITKYKNSKLKKVINEFINKVLVTFSLFVGAFLPTFPIQWLWTFFRFLFRGAIIISVIVFIVLIISLKKSKKLEITIGGLIVQQKNKKPYKRIFSRLYKILDGIYVGTCFFFMKDWFFLGLYVFMWISKFFIISGKKQFQISYLKSLLKGETTQEIN